MRVFKHIFIHTMLVSIGILMGILLSIVFLKYYEEHHSVDCIFHTLNDTEMPHVISLSDFVGNQGVCGKIETWD